jgi:predicted small metal-binding protein
LRARHPPDIFPTHETARESEGILQLKKGIFGENRLRNWRWTVSTSIGCKDLGIDCVVVVEGETGEIAVESLMRHVQSEHTEDWFEIEEIYQAACSVAKAKAA